VADKDFVVRQGLIANTSVKVGNSTINSTINSSSISFSNSTVSTVYAITGFQVPTLTVGSGTTNTSVLVGGVTHSVQTVLYAANTLWNIANGHMGQLTLTGNAVMAAPNNLVSGTDFVLIIVQDGTGSRQITTWNSVFKWPGGVAPTLTTNASAKDVIGFISDGTNLYGSYLNDLK
jgi:hypothetical protein